MKSKKTATNEPSAYAKGYITPAANAVQSAYQGNAGNIQNISNQLTGQLGSMIGKAFTPSASLTAAQGNVQSVLGGDYLNGNQYLDGVVNQTANDVQDRINSIFGSAGRTGGDQHVQVLGRELANAENNVRYQNYSQERQNQMAALGLVPSLEQAQYAGIAPTLAVAQTASGLPQQAAQSYAGSIGSLLGQYNTQTQSSSPSIYDAGKNILGTGLQIASIFSDRRLKVNIERVGEMEDGLGVYEYDYVWGGDRQRGVMADEVAQLRPWALGPTVEGYATVNYGAL